MPKIKEELIKNKTQVYIFAGLITVLVAFLYFNYLLKPEARIVFGLVKKAATMREDIVNTQMASKKNSELKVTIASLKEKVERYEKMLPAEDEIPALLENLSAMAKKANITILGITPIAPQGDAAGKDDKDPVYEELPILISAKCGYHELGIFLTDIENSDRFMKVVDMSIKGSKTSPKKHDVELIVCTYTLPRADVKN